MTAWKYSDAGQTSVVRTLDDGRVESCLIEAIADWIAAGNTPEPADPEPAPVLVATAYQIRQALSQQGLRQGVEAVIAAGDQELKDAWAHADAFERNHPKIEMMRAALSLTHDQVDALFALAVTLKP